jgi:hypothetical protein
MAPRKTPADTRRVLEDLRELIVALDRRVPQLHRTGERDIASDAAALRARAQARIDTLERSLAANAPVVR